MAEAPVAAVAAATTTTTTTAAATTAATAAAASSPLAGKPPKDWSCDDVSPFFNFIFSSAMKCSLTQKNSPQVEEWLKTIGLSEYGASFKENDIQGQQLLALSKVME